MAKEYIDKATLYKEIAELEELSRNRALEPNSQVYQRYIALLDGLTILKNKIHDSPSADVAPVRHGKWIIHTEHFAPYQQCSVCGFEIPVIATENELDIGLFRYCSNCGAKMDLEG